MSKYKLLGVLVLIVAGAMMCSHDDSPTTPEQLVLDKQILGQGDFRYRIRRDRLQVPTAISDNWSHVHGITQGNDGNIYVSFATWGSHNKDTRSLLTFDKHGQFIQTLGTKEDAYGEPHGLDGRMENGNYSLYLSNNMGEVYKTDTQLQRLWSSNFPAEMSMYSRDFQNNRNAFRDFLYTRFYNNSLPIPAPYVPCNIAFHPDGKRLYLADCYGSSYIHILSAQTGEYLGRSFGGKGSEINQYDTPHGLIWDKRKNQLLIADRGNSRLQYTDDIGTTQKVISHADIQQPCDFDIMGEHLLIADLSGHLLILDGDNSPISKLDVASVIGAAGFPHPHDAIFLHNGDIAMGTWLDGSLTYWERLPATTDTEGRLTANASTR